MQFIDYQNCYFVFVIEYYVLNPLFGLFFLFLNSLNFILNHSGIGIPSMHNRNFLFLMWVSRAILYCLFPLYSNNG